MPTYSLQSLRDEVQTAEIEALRRELLRLKEENRQLRKQRRASKTNEQHPQKRRIA
jgi:hypothetical protein